MEQSGYVLASRREASRRQRGGADHLAPRSHSHSRCWRRCPSRCALGRPTARRSRRPGRSPPRRATRSFDDPPSSRCSSRLEAFNTKPTPQAEQAIPPAVCTGHDGDARPRHRRQHPSRTRLTARRSRAATPTAPIRLWDVVRERGISTMKAAHEGAVGSLAFAGTQLVSGGDDGIVRLSTGNRDKVAHTLRLCVLGRSVGERRASGPR